MSPVSRPGSPASAPIADSLSRTIDETEAAATREGGAGRRISTGFVDLDELFGGGLWRGHLTVIGGAPAMGCSTLALNIAHTQVVRHDEPVLYISPDADEVDINQRLLAAEGKVPLDHLRGHGPMTDDDWTKLATAISRLASAQLLLNTTPAMTVPMVEVVLDEACESQNVGLVVVDGLQSLLPATTRESRYFEVCEMVHGLKRLARSHNVAVVLTSKLNRNLEQRADKRPILSDLRNAGDIEDVADEVIFIHRDEMYDAESLRPGEADFVVAKHRYGTTRLITTLFQGHYSRFVDLAY